MDYKLVGVPRPVSRGALAGGDLFVIDHHGRAVHALKVRWMADELALILSGYDALGSSQPFLIAMDAMPDDCARFDGPFRIKPGPLLRDRLDTLGGSLWLDRTGEALVMVNEARRITYFSLRDGSEGVPGAGRRALGAWILETGPDAAPTRILAVNVK
jgi:hypothetical protein